MITLQRRGIVDEYRGYSFARPSVAFDSRSRIALPGNARFESISGRQGVWVEEGATNLLTANQSSVETDTAGFSVIGAGTTLSRTTSEKWHGQASLQVVCDGSVSIQGFAATLPQSAFVAGATYTVSVYLKGAGNVRVFLWQTSPSLVIGSEKRVTLTNEWQRVEVTATMPGSLSGSCGIRVDTDFTPQAVTFYADGLQIEAKPYPTTWTLGGTTRAAETLTVPTAGVLDPNEGTIEGWFHLDTWVNNTGQRTFWQIEGDRFSLPLTADGRLRPYIHDGSYRFAPLYSVANLSGWHYLATTWDGSYMKVFLDGILVSSVASGPISSVGTKLGVGNTAVGMQQINGLIGPLRISRRARTDQEIAAAYAAGYLEADADTTLLLPFDGPDAQRAAKAVVI